MDEYRVTARRSGGWWALEVERPGLRRPAHTQVRFFDRAEETVRDLLALHFDTGVNGRPAASWRIEVVDPWSFPVAGW
ncbi:hypothetical protein ACLQ2R_16260 [Streptosporangium sp. DT93]|uniref:hypothetical protein n=1 Tax=Streptosporangium sp. DT93 TaxID=3393428 RepID=UPI003CF406B0